VGCRVLIGEHLASRGHRRIAFLGGPSQATTRLEREQGLRSALAAHGVEFDPAQSIATSADREGGARAAHLLLRAGEVPDAIVCYSDVVAFGVLAALRTAGIEPGTDVAVASFDDTPEAPLQQPPLTSVTTYPGRTGTVAAELLLRRLEDPGRPFETVLLKPELHARASTANLRLTREQSPRLFDPAVRPDLSVIRTATADERAKPDLRAGREGRHLGRDAPTPSTTRDPAGRRRSTPASRP
jgi:DNA-binding LacI/PurR family transcriptional regulator